MLFTSTSEQVANKYTVYVHLQPEWNSSPGNILYEVTNSWFKTTNSVQEFEKSLENHNENQLQYVQNKSYVELKHDYSNCQDKWEPILYRKAIDTVRHEIEYLQGNELSTDPEISVYPDVVNTSSDKLEQEKKIRYGFAQFIPICTSNDITSYDFSIKIDSDDVGFDVYFVPSVDERRDFYHFEQGFDYYDADGCYATNMKSYTGNCNNLTENSGLLVIVPDSLDKATTKVTVNLYENHS